MNVRDNFDYFKKQLESQAQGDEKLTYINNRMNPSTGKGDLKVVDAVIYSAKAATTALTKMFEPRDAFGIGITNLDRGVTEQGQLMLLERVKIVGFQYAVGDNINAAYIAGVDYTNLKALPFKGFQNAHLTIRTEQKIILFNRIMSDIAEQDGNGDFAEIGTLVLETPKFIRNDSSLEVNIELNGEVLPTRIILKVELKGLMTQTI